MVDGHRQVTQRVAQLLGQPLKLLRPLRPVIDHCNLTTLIGKRHVDARYPNPPRSPEEEAIGGHTVPGHAARLSSCPEGVVCRPSAFVVFDGVRVSESLAGLFRERIIALDVRGWRTAPARCSLKWLHERRVAGWRHE
ncbi:hypothetical protein [Streptomyces sp. ME19-01-6]|uniref:hypothetical protein n=1 Tax=Streptomyces sp. ME19-01-6 TaxID=3028686 RepID=UPI0029B4019C|nr:hypothetical protein [Streptomyces sp. ME19-01-6]MDX3225090.1 hypothetical protein [Streptomyces sp. ME19-01-6]